MVDTPKAYFSVARSYHDAARIVGATAEQIGPERLFMPLQSLISLSIELYFKAFLRARGTPPGAVRRLNLKDNLEVLFREAAAKGLEPVDPAALAEIMRFLTARYEAGEFRYPADESACSPSIIETAWPVLEALDRRVAAVIGAEPPAARAPQA